MMERVRSFALIGPGRVGSSLGAAIGRKGWFCSCIVRKGSNRSQLSKLKSAFHGAAIFNQPSLITDNFKFLLIAVRDDEIQTVVDVLSAVKHIDWESKIIFHTSGVKSVGVLSPFKKLGAAVGALHPIAAFANEYHPAAAKKIYYDFIGDRRALIFARQITKLLDSKLIILSSERDRVLLHIASVIASNFTVIALRKAEKLIADFVSAADAKAMMTSLLSSTVRSLIANDGINSLTGQLARGDIEVISDHIKALESDTSLSQFYKSWSLLGVEELLRDKQSKRVHLRNIKKILEEL